MKTIMDALAEILTVAIVILTQATLIGSMALLAALLVIPEHPVVRDCIKFLKGVL